MKPPRNYNKEALSRSLSLSHSPSEGFRADVKAHFLTAGSARLRRLSPRGPSLDEVLPGSLGRDEAVGSGGRSQPPPSSQGSLSKEEDAGVS